jgi:hypothetical protein
MYYINKKNQALSSSFSQKHSQSVHFTPSEEQLFQIICKYINAPYIYLRNETLASLSGRSIKTVTRATNKFHKNGLITKQQKNRYAPNHFTLSKEIKKHSFTHWINSLSPSNQHLYITHGIRIDHNDKVIFSLRNVPQSNSSSLILNLFINSSPSLHAGVKGKRVFQTNQDPGRKRFLKKGNIMDNFQRKPPQMTKPTKPRQGIYSLWRAPKDPPPTEQMIKLKKDIQALSSKIKLMEDPPHLISYAMHVVKEKMKELEQLQVLHDYTSISH